MDKHQELYEQASQYLVGGISSSFRIHPGLGRPFYLSRGDGSKVYDLDGREYIDLCTSHGASLLGHNHPKINEAVQKAVEMGTLCSYETPYHSQLARRICEMVPCAELVRFTGSGTEATMHTIRLAREYTGKDIIVKFEGHFHGYHDYLQFNWHPEVGPPEFGVPRPPVIESGGMPKGIEQYIIVLPFNDEAAIERTLTERKDEIAAVILEPINYNAGCILPAEGYLEQLRELTAENDVLLIFDEVLSGFRTGPGCAQEHFGVTPDLCTLGKCLGGGLPLSAFAGKGEIMEHVAPLGPSTHSGTYNGHLFQVMAGLAALREISKAGFYEPIYQLSDRLYGGTQEIFHRAKIKARVQGLGARFGFYFGLDHEVKDYWRAAQKDEQLENRFFAAAIKHGVYLHHGWHHGFSAAHTVEDIDRALVGMEAAAREVAG